MFLLPGMYVTPDELNRVIREFNELNQHRDVNIIALIKLLMEKGVFTAEEWERARIQAVGIADQVLAGKREKAAAENAENA